MNPAPSPFYLDWTFWTAVVAVLALILSQVQPVPVLLRRAAITLQPYERLIVTDYLGNPNVNLHIQLMNTGGRAVRVSSLSLEITGEDGKTVAMLAQSFARPEAPTSSLIFTPLMLELGKEWANTVSFWVPFSTSDERESKRLIKNLRTDIQKKLQAQTPDLRGKLLLEAAPALVAPLLAFFKAHQFWRAGEYAVRLTARCEPPRACVERKYRFTLYESDIQELDERTSRYKNGAGVYFNDAEQVMVNPRIQIVG